MLGVVNIASVLIERHSHNMYYILFSVSGQLILL